MEDVEIAVLHSTPRLLAHSSAFLAGPLLEDIINEFKNRRDNPLSKKIFQIYSGHDATLIGLMDTLNVYDETKAHYSASVLAELRKLDKKYIVTVSSARGNERLTLGALGKFRGNKSAYLGSIRRLLCLAYLFPFASFSL